MLAGKFFYKSLATRIVWNVFHKNQGIPSYFVVHVYLRKLMLLLTNFYSRVRNCHEVPEGLVVKNFSCHKPVVLNRIVVITRRVWIWLHVCLENSFFRTSLLQV